nr:nucleotide-binding alpha-beta plait domain-containing protein [Tanacetum cinerariifolium]
SKDGKRFGFVRFINVFNVKRLMSNLCTIWVDRSKFHVNIARFYRAPLNNNKVPTEQKFGYNRNINNVRAKEGVTTGSSKSYVHAVKVKNMFGALECDSMPSIVLDDECLISKDLSKALLGRENMRVGSWFSVLKQASSDFIPEGIIEKEGFHSKRLCIYSKSDDSDDDDESDNGFKDGDAEVSIYELLLCPNLILFSGCIRICFVSSLFSIRIMGSYRSKEDDVSRISTSIYVSNFPESFSAKDLFHSCKQYGHVVDTFIPFKRSKDGKRFGFVCFINVFNVERLMSNLCTIWVDRSKFHANIARFHRAPLNNNKVPTEQKFGYNRNINNVRAKEGVTTGSSKSYVHAVKIKNMFGALECDSMPSIVLDDECLISKDLSKALLGRVKDFTSLPNLKIVLKNEGFAEIKIRYMGEFWVMLKFPSSKTKELFQENMRVGSVSLCGNRSSLNTTRSV